MRPKSLNSESHYNYQLDAKRASLLIRRGQLDPPSAIYTYQSLDSRAPPRKLSLPVDIRKRTFLGPRFAGSHARLA